ncbi:O-sialoglycoprotein endopeptidase [Heliophilum fasciatum]|uniref:N(6)-L-threonylcarbamoyladenine synthase n=1 Tax=Heliophilum fasciatum TaxID=35700 RepID=A0A4R2RSD8_9FIRM|nr:O-sialoglycoprotein endopeptidase [Heliophilum fasciatum]MCW2277335.1 N6-L-threonylcarbamoyladenine synthase [Heliophilum fasciatum]TCP67172.1 N6-L-threonylcarbamoyladenine synthase [Heliophilum fasciatum]
MPDLSGSMGPGQAAGVLGVDTSCYTTSLALVDQEGKLRAEARKILPVAQGERGLRQGEALFCHVQQLPGVMEALYATLQGQAEALPVKAVAVAVRPRPDEASYLPVFRAGESMARCLAAVLQVPLIATSHQEGHLMAGLYSAFADHGREWLERPFLAVHLSGGTTELLLVQPGQDGALAIDKLGGTTDLHAGQLVDRIGVALGLPFPAGPAFEGLAATVEGTQELTFTTYVHGYEVSFSGVEAQALRQIAHCPGPLVARAVEAALAKTLEKWLRRAIEETGLRRVLIVGGVAANGYLRQRLRRRLEHRAVGATLAFATPALSGDNAVGVAVMGWRQVFSKDNR